MNPAEKFAHECADKLPSTEERQAALIREFKSRYHEMGARLAFLESKLENCKAVIQYAASPWCAQTEFNHLIRSDAQKLLDNWPSEKLYWAFNQDSYWSKLQAIVPKPPEAITWEQGVKIINFIQKTTWNDEPLNFLSDL